MAAASGVGALRPRGRQLYRDMEAGRSPGQLALLLEACRTADRLEELNGLLLARRGQWARLRLPRRVGDLLESADGDQLEVELIVSVDSLLAEARQQAIVYRQLILAVTASDAPAATGKGVGAGDDGDELGRIRAARDAAAGRS